jgi:hypothetical protein
MVSGNIPSHIGIYNQRYMIPIITSNPSSYHCVVSWCVYHTQQLTLQYRQACKAGPQPNGAPLAGYPPSLVQKYFTMLRMMNTLQHYDNTYNYLTYNDFSGSENTHNT